MMTRYSDISRQSSRHYKRLIRQLALVLAVCSTALVQAAVYKTTDAEGNIVYTDVPPKNAEGEQQQPLELPTENVYQPTVTAAPPVPEDDEDEADDTFSYKKLSITSPTHDSAIRENAGNLTVYTRVEPGLQDGHEVRVLLDGVPWPVRSQGAVAMTNIDRGTHRLTAQVVDADDQILISSDPVTFHMLRVSVLTRPGARNTP